MIFLLLETTENLLNNDDLRATLRAVAPAHLKKHTPQVIGKRYVELINNSLNGH